MVSVTRYRAFPDIKIACFNCGEARRFTWYREDIYRCEKCRALFGMITPKLAVKRIPVRRSGELVPPDREIPFEFLLICGGAPKYKYKGWYDKKDGLVSRLSVDSYMITLDGKVKKEFAKKEDEGGDKPV